MQNTLKRLMDFVSSRGSEESTKRKKSKISESEMKMALLAYQTVTLAESNNTLAKALQQMSNALLDSRDPSKSNDSSKKS